MDNKQHDNAPTSFSTYASRFLSQPQLGNQQSPLFHNDIPDPYLASPSSSSHASLPQLRGSPPDMDSLYEQDEDEDLPSASGLLFQDPASPPPRSSVKGKERSSVLDVGSTRNGRGWLAHQSIFPPSSSSSASITPPDSPRASKHRETAAYELEDSDAEGSFISEKPSDPPSPPPRKGATHLGIAPPPGEGLDEPLLGDNEQDASRGRERIPVKLEVYQARFGVWSDGQGIVLRKFKDSGFLALWLSSLMTIVFALLFVWGSTDPAPRPGPDSPFPSPTPFSTLLHTLPLLFPLLLISLAFPLGFLFLLKHTVRPVITATAALVPVGLFGCAWWAFIGSFGAIGDGTVERPIEGSWWGTTGLRLFSLVLLLMAGLFARIVWRRRRRLERTVAVVELSTTLLLTHPPMLLLTPILLGAFALISLPFLTLALRLLLVGFYRHPRENTWVWHVKPYAGFLVFLVTLIWLWTWGVVRGVGRVAVAAIVGEWYFHRDDPEHPPALEVTQAAVHRATGSSLGSVCLGALIVASVRMVGRTAAEARRITNPRSQILPTALSFLSRLTPVFSILAGVLDQLNGYALVYVGITGESFWPSARRAVGLAGRRRAGKLLDYTLIKLLLTLSSTTLALCTATAGYLYAAHTLGAPAHAPLAALLCGGVPFLCVRAGAGVLGDAADALFICYQIDREAGGDHSEKAEEAFAGDTRRLDRTV